MKYCFGVDVGGTTVKIGLFQADGVLVDKWEIKTRTENKGEAILPDIAEAIAEKCKKDGIAREDMEGIGIACCVLLPKQAKHKDSSLKSWPAKADVSAAPVPIMTLSVDAGS